MLIVELFVAKGAYMSYAAQMQGINKDKAKGMYIYNVNLTLRGNLWL